MSHKFYGGVHPAEHKEATERKPVIPLEEAPAQVVIPMSMHVGAPCKPIVAVGDEVTVGQKIGEIAGLGAPIHASVSGKVVAVEPRPHAGGGKMMSVVIENDFKDTPCETIRHRDNVDVLTPQEIIDIVKEAGITGMGGAGFPTHVKLSGAVGKVDTILINGAECEPYITVDYRECLENSWDILSSIYTLKELFGFKRVVIAAEDNKPEAFKVLKRIADQDLEDDNVVRLMTLKSKYPQGAEKMMVYSATGRKVPPGKLPADVGCVVMNVASVAFIARYLKSGKPLVSRSLTVDGSAIAEPKNVRVPIGMNVGEIIDFCGGFKAEPGKIITGGPMMGLAVINTDIPVLKQNNAILAFADDASKVKKERDCIRCGRCAAACPLSLMPTLIERYTKAKDVERLEKIGVNVCMECGSCAYSCPAAKPLVQYMRLAKQLLREEKSKNA